MKMAACNSYDPHRLLLRSYFRQKRVSLSVLFSLVVALSVLLTIVSINESMRVRHMLGIIATNAIRQPEVDAQHEIALSNTHTTSGVNHNSLSGATTANDTTWSLLRSRHVLDQKRQSGIERLRRFKSKLLLLKRGPFLIPSENVPKPGWRLLSGNVVVPDGDVANPHDYAYVTNAEEACTGMVSSTSGDRVGLLIFVESDARNAERRQVIRQTWALPLLQKALNYRVVFMLGRARSREMQDVVEEEFYAYGDVVQENFTESFKHLTLKSVMGLKWALGHCDERFADYVMKTDDDILVHVPNMMRMLQADIRDRSATSNVILCHKNRSRQIVRREPKMLKYQVSPLELPGSYFPHYCGGFAYVMRMSVVRSLYEASVHIPYFFIEDVYVTGFCRHRAGVGLVDHPDIVLRPHVTVDQAPCHFSEGRITSQELTSDEMKSIWQTLNTRGFFCPVPVASAVNSSAATTVRKL